MSKFRNTCAVLACAAGAAHCAPRASALVIDHTYQVPVFTTAFKTAVHAWSPIVHYAHRSDGSAVPFGLNALRQWGSGNFPYVESDLPSPAPSGEGLRFWMGMPADDYVYPSGYWASAAGRQDLATFLKAHPEISISTWTWCNEDDYWSVDGDSTGSDNARAYFRWMDSLERAFPQVTFVYQTAAMREPDGGDRAHQADFNDSVRAMAIRRRKILFDVADLDVWHAGQQNLVQADGRMVPYQHPAWAAGNGPTNNGHHANDSLGIDHGRAWWALMAKLLEERGTTSIAPFQTENVEPRLSQEGDRLVWSASGGERLRVELRDLSGREIARGEGAGSVEIPLRVSGKVLVARVRTSGGSWSRILGPGSPDR